MKGWEEQIITPLNDLLKHQGKRLMWKEKWGEIRCEWLISLTGGGIEGTLHPNMERVIEEASKLCCCRCGRWNGWMKGDEKEFAKVTTSAVKGWMTTLCQHCLKEVRGEDQSILDHQQGG